MKKYLGIDLGSKSLGLAFSESGIIANAYKTLYFKEDDYNEGVMIIKEIVIKDKFTDVVIGLPKHMNNDLGIRGEISIAFKESLLKELPDLNIHLWDERGTTKQAIKTMVKSNLSRKKQKQKKDEVAAVIILQNYLDYKENF